MKKILEEKTCFILDMDGTFYIGEALLEGALEAVSMLRSTGKQVVFFTNNSSKTSRDYVEKLNRMGCRISLDGVITSGEVSAGFLRSRYPGKRIYLLGTPQLRQYLLQEGIAVVDDHPDIVLAAFDTTLRYDRLSEACRCIREGALFLATHPDLNCPVEGGFIPDCGSICACITASTGVVPRYLGKPHTETVAYLEEKLQVSREQMVLIGDRLYTEIAMGSQHDITTVLVLTGETKREDLKQSSVQPDIILDRLGDITDML